MPSVHKKTNGGLFVMHKRTLFLIITVMSVLLLSSCKAIKDAVIFKTPDLNKPFTSGFNIKTDDSTEIIGTMTRYGTGIWEMDITEPETLAGLHLTYNDEGVNASLGELNFTIAPEKINSSAIFQLIFNAIDNCAAQTEYTLTDTETAMEYTGEIAQCSYMVIFDRETMNPIGITFPDLNISAELSDFSNIVSETVEPNTTSETISSQTMAAE